MLIERQKGEIATLTNRNQEIQALMSEAQEAIELRQKLAQTEFRLQAMAEYKSRQKSLRRSV